MTDILPATFQETRLVNNQGPLLFVTDVYTHIQLPDGYISDPQYKTIHDDTLNRISGTHSPLEEGVRTLLTAYFTWQQSLRRSNTDRKWVQTEAIIRDLYGLSGQPSLSVPEVAHTFSYGKAVIQRAQRETLRGLSRFIENTAQGEALWQQLTATAGLSYDPEVSSEN